MTALNRSLKVALIVAVGLQTACVSTPQSQSLANGPCKKHETYICEEKVGKATKCSCENRSTLRDILHQL